MTPVNTSARLAAASRLQDSDESAPVAVNCDQFMTLLVCRRRLARADLPNRGLYGLIDEEDGSWYVVPDRDLDRWRVAPR